LSHAEVSTPELHNETPRQLDRRFDEIEEIWRLMVNTARKFQDPTQEAQR